MKPNPVHDFLLPIINGRHIGSSTIRHSDFSPASKSKVKCGAEDPSLWSAFWQEFCLENVPHERCHIPGDGRHAVDRHWTHLADQLPPGAQVIDLGCGAGIVGRLLLSRRNDLRVTGIDFANVPTPSVENLVIHPWVSMEALPFDAGRFDVAISLFGIEYGNIDRTAGELGRVLKPGARFSFLVHHIESEIVCEGSTRRRALRDLLSGKVKAPFLAGSIAGVDQQIKRLKNQFPGEPSIKHFSNYLRHHVALTRAERQAKWQNLLDGLNPEIALLTLLERSAKSAAEMGSWLASLLPIMRMVSVSVLRRNSGEPIAWQVNGNR
jgi:ubiquinone/menaquinone biosynthesis C-methylase UbiE